MHQPVKLRYLKVTKMKLRAKTIQWENKKI